MRLCDVSLTRILKQHLPRFCIYRYRADVNAKHNNLLGHHVIWRANGAGLKIVHDTIVMHF